MANDTVKALLAKALRRRKELQLEFEALQRLIRDYQQIQEMRDEAQDEDQLHLWHGGSKRAAKKAEVADILQEVRRILIAEGAPMKRGALVRKLEAKGYRLSGDDKSKVLGTNIWRSGKFDHISGHGYWPKNLALPVGISLL